MVQNILMNDFVNFLSMDESIVYIDTKNTPSVGLGQKIGNTFITIEHLTLTTSVIVTEDVVFVEKSCA